MSKSPGIIENIKSLVARTSKAFSQARRLEGIAVTRTGVEALRILQNEYGLGRGVCEDAQGRPLPWYTYPAIEYIRQLDFTEKSIFEYGSGNSSLFWSGLARQIVSVEDDAEWFEKVSSQKKPNMDVRLASSPQAYVDEIHRDGSKYDVIVIDGSHRLQCVDAAVSRLADGGLIILDNSDWYPKTSALLRQHDFLEVDMTGFGPINGYAWTTSFFFHRNFRFQPLKQVQPKHGAGALQQYGPE